MGAVRIYKAARPSRRYGKEYSWCVRSNGCKEVDSWSCNFGEDHEGICDDFIDYDRLLEVLNNPASPLGEYLNK